MTGSHDTLAPYAIRSDHTSGRDHAEADDPLRDAFALDRHRIVESTAFRRLEHKTQVFAPVYDDHIRTRLTHTLEAAVIARTLASALRANETLAEAITLAHDLGHPPFGHAGEVALNEAMSEHGGFNHNAHSLRVVEYLEHPFPPFRGLNLTCETRSGLRTHATRYDAPGEAAINASTAGATESQTPAENREDTTRRACNQSNGPSVEARIASVADRVAYDCHDLEDAIGAGLVSLDALRHLPIWRRSYDERAAALGDRSIHAVRRVVLDAMLSRVLCDVVDVSADRLAAIDSPEHAKSSAVYLVGASPSIDCELSALEDFLRTHVYEHPDIARTDAQGRAMIHALFATYLGDPTRLPERFTSRIDAQGPHRVVCDYIGGMTDRFCTREYEKSITK